MTSPNRRAGFEETDIVRPGVAPQERGHGGRVSRLPQALPVCGAVQRASQPAVHRADAVHAAGLRSRCPDQGGTTLLVPHRRAGLRRWRPFRSSMPSARACWSGRASASTASCPTPSSMPRCPAWKRRTTPFQAGFARIRRLPPGADRPRDPRRVRCALGPIYVLIAFLIHPWMGVLAFVGALIAAVPRLAERAGHPRAACNAPTRPPAAPTPDMNSPPPRRMSSARSDMREALVNGHLRDRQR